MNCGDCRTAGRRAVPFLTVALARSNRREPRKNSTIGRRDPVQQFLLADHFAAPLHHHTADHYVTVVSGTLILIVDGKENKLPAGSYFSFTGKAKHETKCDAGAECVLFVDARGKWDVVPEEAPKKPADPKAK